MICAFEFLLGIVLICWTHGEQHETCVHHCSADVAQLARAPPCQGGGRGFESRHPLATPSGWGGRVVTQRPATPRTRVRFPSPPRSDFRHRSKAASVGICKTCVSYDETQARLAQLVSALLRHGTGHWFDSSTLHDALPVCYADVAQLARAPPCQGGGRGFESRHPLWCCYEA